MSDDVSHILNEFGLLVMCMAQSCLFAHG